MTLVARIQFSLRTALEVNQTSLSLVMRAVPPAKNRTGKHDNSHKSQVSLVKCKLNLHLSAFEFFIFSESVSIASSFLLPSIAQCQHYIRKTLPPNKNENEIRSKFRVQKPQSMNSTTGDFPSICASAGVSPLIDSLIQISGFSF